MQQETHPHTTRGLALPMPRPPTAAARRAALFAAALLLTLVSTATGADTTTQEHFVGEQRLIGWLGEVPRPVTAGPQPRRPRSVCS
jgi:hypothetical protein